MRLQNLDGFMQIENGCHCTNINIQEKQNVFGLHTDILYLLFAYKYVFYCTYLEYSKILSVLL